MIIGLTGYARSGKDSAANWLVEHHGFVKMAFADGVRQMALAIDPMVEQPCDETSVRFFYERYSKVLETEGYEQAKSYPDVRRLLQRIGTEGGRDIFGANIWVDAVRKRIGELPLGSTKVVLSDVRFPNEAKAIKEMGGTVIRLSRPGVGGNDPHPSEAQIAGLNADLDICATNLDELYAQMELAYAGIQERRVEFVKALLASEIEPARTPRVYLAAPWVCIEAAGYMKQRMVDAGIDVISDWTEREEDSDKNPNTQRDAAIIDMQQVRDCDALVLLSMKTRSEGKASEMGMAMALGKRIILVGPREGNVFYNHPMVEQVDTVWDAITLLGR